ncbi:MAG: PD40 domain-containing protein, partial [Chloroflexi bacterium]|nr:PD40 domain-containing protein [Chloroflexota bacterium]
MGPDLFRNGNAVYFALEMDVHQDKIRAALGAEANGGSYRPSISGDGRYIAFESSAANLVAGAPDGSAQIFVHDQVTGKTTLVSTTSAGLPGRGGSSFDAAISADGKFVAFLSEATNLGSPAGTRGVYVHDMTTGQTALVSVTSDGTPGNSGPDTPPSISGDGRFVAFDSLATNLVAGDTNGVADIFVRDRQTGQTTRVSVATDGTQANYLSWNPSISADGNFVAFSSLATNLVPDDTNGYADIFVRNTTSGQTYRVSLGPISAQGNSDADLPSISGDGRFVSFRAADQSIIPGDANGVEDIFLYDRDSVPPPPTEGCFTLDVTSGEGGAANAIAQSQPNCESGHPAGSYVWLQAIPDRDHVFAGWSGDAVGAKQLLIVQMTGNKTVTANFLPKPIKPVVLLVHGWLGAQDDPPDHCQADPINYEPGSPSPIFDFGIIPSQLEPDGFDAFVAHLNSGPGAASDVFQNAVCLRQQIASLRAKGVDKVVLLAHGAGGLVSRAYIESPVKGFYAGDVSKLITLGTPHTGTGYNSAPCLGDLSNAACLLTFYGSDLFNEIYPERAADVEYDFIGGKLDPLPGWPLLVTDGDNDGVVGVYSGMGQRLMVNENKVETIVTGDKVARYAIAAGHSNSNALLFPSYFNAASPTDTTITETYQCIRKILGVSGGTCPPEGQASGRGPITAISFSETSRNRIALASTSLAAEPVAASARSFSGRLAADGVASHIVPVDSSGHAAFILTWSGDPLTFGLTDPEGKTIDPLYATQHPEEVTYKDNAADVSARHVAIYAFNAASPGLYILTITAGAVGPSGADYVAATLVESTRILKATTDYRLYAIGHTAKITAQLVNGDTALTGAQVQAEFYRPGVVDDAVTLADQGDGTYTGTFTIPDVPGYVGLRVTAQGSDGAVLYARQLDDMIAIAPLTAQLTGQYSVSLSDIDGKGKYDSLNIAVGLNMAQPGNYAVSADLVGANGEPVAHTSLVAALRPGAQYVTLPFDGDEIRRSGTNGPYTLTNFTVADEQAAGVPAIWRAANLMQTDGYQSADFAATCYTLDLSGVRGGTASADPAPNCYDGLQYVAGAEVTLTAHPDAGNFLTGWTSGASGSAETVSVKMNQDIAVGARFSIAPPAT